MSLTLLAVSDAVWQALIAGVVTIVLAYMARRIEKKTDVAAVKVEEVRKTLEVNTTATEATLAAIAATGEKTHTLVNSAMGAQLVAELAEEMLLNHQQKQAVVDRGGNGEP
jgi:hypothetical protein